ncbi:MAG: lipoate--protein ligase family protein [Euryarchaeota archaeon]|nr:lipoate--protein ligase family protein [Euryarchaeota archaeon]MBU4220310.1 lipoate--protein ligase family protein [Euryarchaeota archaeon]MBU4454189.1 lipoate--protein ligase family protein [Euryarchaeota archaeon]MCG2738039.1 lipoate--protein ligase family protein [Candidatus Methanoperedenaceae archaeon]
MKWRVVELETHDAYLNMALDEAISEGIMNGSSPPTIRFYTWKPGAVSIGCFQSMKDEVNLQTCRELGVDCIRRWTGGGAVYHDPKGEITYSLIAPASSFPKNIIKSYEVICGWIVDGLKTLGIDAEFSPVNDIIVKGKKISGSAQTRRGGVLLQHGTILYDLDLATMFGVLNVSKQKITDKMILSAQERVTSISAHRNVDKIDVYKALVKAFIDGKDYELGTWSRDELARARELSEKKYKSEEWIYLR